MCRGGHAPVQEVEVVVVEPRLHEIPVVCANALRRGDGTGRGLGIVDPGYFRYLFFFIEGSDIFWKGTRGGLGGDWHLRFSC